MGRVVTTTVSTERTRHAIDVTDHVAAHLPNDGFVHVSVPHTTCALVVSEPDPELLLDIERVVTEMLAPFEPFQHSRHDNPNAAAHIMSSVLGASTVVRVAGGLLCLGRWQRIVLVELDGPKERTLEVAWLGSADT